MAWATGAITLRTICASNLENFPILFCSGFCLWTPQPVYHLITHISHLSRTSWRTTSCDLKGGLLTAVPTLRWKFWRPTLLTDAAAFTGQAYPIPAQVLPWKTPQTALMLARTANSVPYSRTQTAFIHTTVSLKSNHPYLLH